MPCEFHLNILFFFIKWKISIRFPEYTQSQLFLMSATLWCTLIKSNCSLSMEKAMAPHSSNSCLENPVDSGAWWATVRGVAESWTRLKRLIMHACIEEGNGSPLQCSCLENPRDGGACGLPSLGSHRVGHDWSDLEAAAAAAVVFPISFTMPGNSFWCKDSSDLIKLSY